MATDKPEPGRGKGFAGLSDIVSEVPGADLARPAPNEPIRSPQGKVVSDPTSAPEPKKSPYRPVQMPTGNEPTPAMAKWLAGLVSLMIIFWIVNSTSKKVEVSTTYNQQSPSYNAPQAPALLEPLYESIPPVGSRQLLNFVQLRFCIGEKIRLDALEVLGHNNVKRYNAKVKFFNDRCSRYRYKVTDFNSVTQDQHDRKDLLAKQARFEWFRADDLEANSKAKAAKPNLAKPFKVLGADTNTAPPLPTPAPTHQAPKSNGLPVNAKLDFTGTGWVCVSGYRQIGNECTRIELPPNAIIDYLGSDWTCKRGFRKQGTRCEVVDIPQNAVLDYLGSDWTCKRGYRINSNSCVAVQVPLHANLDYLGSDWTCNPGYRQTGNFCVPN